MSRKKEREREKKKEREKEREKERKREIDGYKQTLSLSVVNKRPS